MGAPFTVFVPGACSKSHSNALNYSHAGMEPLIDSHEGSVYWRALSATVTHENCKCQHQQQNNHFGITN